MGLEKLNAYIAEHGLRHTIEREMVLEEACRLPQPFTTGQLIEQMEKRHVSKATVYNVVQLLGLARILQCVHRASTRERVQYEIITQQTQRMQLKCTKCGRVAEFYDVAIINLVRARKYNNFNMQSFSLYVYGECKLCRSPKRITAKGELVRR